MGLKVIGAGFSRTGTESLKIALEHLGFGKCYHMHELARNPGHMPYWKELLAKNQTDFDKLFAGYQSAVDLPACNYYHELMAEYPLAKVILTVRDPDQWYESASNTVYLKLPDAVIRVMSIGGIVSPKMRWFVRFVDYLDEFMFDYFIQGKSQDPEASKELFIQWNKKVIETVPAEKLLVFHVKEGWEPLCRFLEVPVPDIPFPVANMRTDYFKTVNKLFPFLFDSKWILRKPRTHPDKKR